MDLNSLTSYLSQPIGLALIALVLITLAAAFLFPAFLNLLRIPTLSSIKTTINRYPKLSLVILMFVIVLIASGYFLYIKDRPVILSAESFKQKEAQQLELYAKAHSGYELSKENPNLMILDIRSKKAYQTAHLYGSGWIDLNYLMTKSLKLGIKVALYSEKDNLKTARRAADHLAKYNKEKIYIIKDGIEGLKEAGFKIVENNNRPFGEQI